VGVAERVELLGWDFFDRGFAFLKAEDIGVFFFQ